MVLDRLAAFDAEMSGIIAVGGPTLGQLEIMDRHYGVINQLSRNASSVLPKADVEKLAAEAGGDPSHRVLGGHEVLAEKPRLTPAKLNELWATKPSVRLRGGTYGQHYDIDGEPVFLVNAFHPDQLVHFTGKDRRIVLLVVHSDLPWSVLRGRLVGDTFPDRAVPGSIRRALYDDPQRYGQASVNISNNCVHLSAGPFEALFELRNFLGGLGVKAWREERSRMAQALTKAGFTGETTSITPATNVNVGGQQIGVIDATEDVDTISAAQLLVAGTA
jgi:hypothetical protein